MPSRRFRVERDSLGPVRVPSDALYGAQTQRAIENFPISGWRFPRSFLQALGLIKASAAAANRRLRRLDARTARAIESAALLVASTSTSVVAAPSASITDFPKFAYDFATQHCPTLPQPGCELSISVGCDADVPRPSPG